MSAVEPRFFGPPAEQLFGVYHAPQGRGARAAGVLLCYPGPQEYMRCHWAFRKLAALLARAGLHVLRFDYYGSGDSAGASDAGTPARWRRDIAAALVELRELAGTARASVVGYRLGAALAAQAPLTIHDLVLWEPVVSGREHLAELHAQHERRFAHCLHPPATRGALLGLPFPDATRAAIEALELGAPLGCRAERVHVLGAAEQPSYTRLLESLRAAHAAGGAPAVTWHAVPERTTTDDEDAFLLATHAQQAIAALLTGREVAA